MKNGCTKSARWPLRRKLLLSLIIIISFYSRFRKLCDNPYVHPEEVIHWNHINNYHRNTYFLDGDNLPFGGMLYALVMKIVMGYEGRFLPSSNINYLDHGTDFIGFRSVIATIGSIIPVIIFYILLDRDTSDLMSFGGALVVALDWELIEHSSFINNRPLLGLLLLLVLFCYTKDKIRMFACGIFLGCLISTKPIGAGFWAIIMLYSIFCNRLSGFYLILLPIITISLLFHTHLSLLQYSGSNGKMMSLRFQKCLRTDDVGVKMEYGEQVHLKSCDGFVYLHSCNQTYPIIHQDGKISSGGWQVVGSPIPTANTFWILESDEDKKNINSEDKIRLRHVETNRYLTCHDVASPLTTHRMEITTTPRDGIDTLWRIEEIGGCGLFETGFKLVHVETGAVLNNQGQKLPSWGKMNIEINGDPCGYSKSIYWHIVSTKGLPKSYENKASALERLFEYEIHILKMHVDRLLNKMREEPCRQSDSLEYIQTKKEKKVIRNRWTDAFMFLGLFLFLHINIHKLHVRRNVTNNLIEVLFFIFWIILHISYVTFRTDTSYLAFIFGILLSCISIDMTSKVFLNCIYLEIRRWKRSLETPLG